MYSKATFAKQLKTLIDRQGITQAVLAEKINTTEATISRYVSGARTPNIETAVEIAHVLCVSVDELMGVEPPSAERVSPDVSILISSYNHASPSQREALWSILGSYGLLSPEQYALIDSILDAEKVGAV